MSKVEPALAVPTKLLSTDVDRMKQTLVQLGIPQTDLDRLPPGAIVELIRNRRKRRIKVSGVWDTVENLYETVKEGGEQIVDTVKEAGESVINKIGDTLENAIEAVKKTSWDDISNAIDDAGTFLEDLGQQAQDWTFSEGLDKAADLWNDSIGKLPGGEAINPFAAITAMDEMVSGVLGYSIFTNNPLGPMTPFGMVSAIGTGLKEAKKAGTEAWKLIEATFDEDALNDLEALLPKPGEDPAAWIGRAADSAERLRSRALEASSKAYKIGENAWDNTILSPFLKQYERVGEGSSALHDIVGDFMKSDLARSLIETPLGGGNVSEKDVLTRLAYWAVEQAKKRVNESDSSPEPVVDNVETGPLLGPDEILRRRMRELDNPTVNTPSPINLEDQPAVTTGHDQQSVSDRFLLGPQTQRMEAPEQRMMRVRSIMSGQTSYGVDQFHKRQLDTALDYMDQSIGNAKRARYY